MSLNTQTLLWDYGEVINTNCSIEQFIQNLTNRTKKLRDQGFVVEINKDRSGDEWYDAPLTHFEIKYCKTIEQELLDKLINKMKEDFQIKQDNYVQEYRNKFINYKGNDYLTSKIKDLEKVLEHVIVKKGATHPAVADAQKGLDRAKEQLRQEIEKVQQEIDNPTPRKEILNQSYHNSWDFFFNNYIDSYLVNEFQK